MQTLQHGALSVVRFARRHRRALLIGAVGGVVVAGAIRARRAFDDATDMVLEAEQRLMEQTRRQHHLERAKDESHQALLNFLSALSSELKAVTGRLPALLREIKVIRSSRSGEAEVVAREAQLWEELKVASFTAFLTSFYAFNLLQLVLQLQMHILAREFRANDQAMDMEARGQLLSVTYKFMLGQGLVDLAELVKRVVADVMADFSFQSSLFTCDELVQVVRSIRDRVEGSPRPTASRSPLLAHVICPAELTAGASPQVQHMLDETWDVVESPVFQSALCDSLDKSLHLVATQLDQAVFSASSASPDVGDGEPTAPTPKPLAALLPFLKPQKLVMQLHDGRCVHADGIANLPSVRELCVAVFDASDATHTAAESVTPAAAQTH